MKTLLGTTVLLASGMIGHPLFLKPAALRSGTPNPLRQINKAHKPHIGAKECQRRFRQITVGSLRSDNGLAAPSAAEYFRTHRSTGPFDFGKCPRARIGDLTLSIQVSGTHYCTPRDNVGPWSTVEVGFPDRKIRELMPYAEDADGDPKNEAYGYVPITLLNKVLGRFGDKIAPEENGEGAT